MAIDTYPDQTEISKGTVTEVSNLVKGTITALEKGTISAGTIGTVVGLGTASNLGSVTNVGTIKGVDVVSDITTGSLTNIAFIHTIGTMPAVGGGTQFDEDTGHSTGAGGNLNLAVRVDGGTSLVSDTLDYAPLQVDAAGALRIVGTTVTSIGEQGGGTLDTIGTLGSIGDVGVIHNAGTIAALPDSPGGTVDLVTGVGTLGSVSNLGSVTNIGTLKGLDTVTTVTDLTSGSVVVTSGTLGSVVNVAQIHNAGTIQAGTIQIDSVPARPVIRYGTLGTTGAEVRGTLIVAAGAGDNYYLEGYEILVHSGTVDAAIEFGTKAVVGGTDTFGRGKYVEGGGVTRPLPHPVITGDNGTITFYMGGAGTVFFGVDYYEVG